MEKKHLRDGTQMPVIGLGLYLADSRGNATDAVLSGIECGYRLFDCAVTYKNEEELGQALKQSGLKREEYFVVSKLPEASHGYEEAKRELHNSLGRLGMEFIDLYLIHSPSGHKNVDTWKALLDLQKEGKARNVGVSNFNVCHLEGLSQANLPVPNINQIELHPWLQQREVVDYCRKKDIALMAYSPLARCEAFGSCPLLDSLVEKYKHTKAQILLRWSIQKDFITIPKSSLKVRQGENINIFDFELSQEDMAELDNLECDMRVSNHTIKLPWQG